MYYDGRQLGMWSKLGEEFLDVSGSRNHLRLPSCPKKLEPPERLKRKEYNECGGLDRKGREKAITTRQMDGKVD